MMNFQFQFLSWWEEGWKNRGPRTKGRGDGRDKRQGRGGEAEAETEAEARRQDRQYNHITSNLRRKRARDNGCTFSRVWTLTWRSSMRCKISSSDSCESGTVAAGALVELDSIESLGTATAAATREWRMLL